MTVIAGLVLLLPVAAGNGARNPTPSALRARIDVANEKVRRALVRIRVVSTEFREGREVKRQEVGSGVIITKDGYLITNHHVAGHAARMFCTLWNREEIEAELIGTDPLTDISVLKLKPEKPREFAPASFGDSSASARRGFGAGHGQPDGAVAIGHAGHHQQHRDGFAALLGRVGPVPIGRRGCRLAGARGSATTRQFTAAIPAGRWCNLRGEIVGINEISYGLSGAIPGNLAKAVARQLMARGKIQRSWLGIDPQPLFKEWQEEKGLLIAGVWEDSPAAKAGLKAGDLLLSLAGKPINVRFDEQMPDFMALSTSLPLGRPVSAVVKREGKEIDVSMVPVERGEIYPRQQEFKQWGLTARNFSFLLAREMKRPNLDGVLVTIRSPGRPCRRGQAIPGARRCPGGGQRRAGQVGVRTWWSGRGKLSEGQSEPVPVMATFERRAARYLAVVRVGIEEEKDPGLEVTKAWLPVETRVISREIANQLGRPELKGFYLTRVYPDSTAEKAGLKPGDFIVALDGEKLTASGPEHEDELTSLIRQYDVGKTVELSVLRDKKRNEDFR